MQHYSKEKNIIFLIITFLCFCGMVFFSIREGFLDTLVPYSLLVVLFFSGEVFVVESKRWISRVVFGVLFVLWLLSFAVSQYFFSNLEFFSSIIGYTQIMTDTQDSAFIGIEGNKGKRWWRNFRVYTYIIDKDKIDVEIPKILHPYFGDDYTLKVRFETQDPFSQKCDVIQGDRIPGSIFIYDKGGYYILRLY